MARTRSLASVIAQREAARLAAIAKQVALPAPVRAEALANFLQPAGTDVLVAVLQGVNLEAVVRKELANRGLGADGKWLGFAEAEVAFDDWYSSNRRSEEGAHQGVGL